MTCMAVDDVEPIPAEGILRRVLDGKCESRGSPPGSVVVSQPN